MYVMIIFWLKFLIILSPDDCYDAVRLELENEKFAKQQEEEEEGINLNFERCIIFLQCN